MAFIGRSVELADLAHMLERIRRGDGIDRGIAVAVRGRRRVGKSRLLTEFIRRTGAPSVYFQAARGADQGEELAEFASTIAHSTLPAASLAAGIRPTTLTAALNLLATCLPADSPSIVVIDEIPWLLEGFPGGSGELQRVWDRELSARPVLLALLGSDLSMMERFTRPEEPFHGRATPMVLDVLTPADVATMTGLAPFDAFDAYLVTGGQPLVLQEWEPGQSLRGFVETSFRRSTSALVVSGMRVLDAEFPESAVSREVLTAIGARGERTFTRIRGAVRGDIAASTLTASLRTLADKRVVAADEPLSVRPAPKDRRWRIADPSLRFWLAFVGPALAEIDRGRPDLAYARVERGFESWRGRAIEPVVRESLARLLPDDSWPTTRAIGGWWPRSNDPEVDVVGADGRPASEIAFVGTIKWGSSRAVGAREVAALSRDALTVPGVSAATPLVAVTGVERVRASGLAHSWTAADLLAAWP